MEQAMCMDGASMKRFHPQKYKEDKLKPTMSTGLNQKSKVIDIQRSDLCYSTALLMFSCTYNIIHLEYSPSFQNHATNGPSHL